LFLLARALIFGGGRIRLRRECRLIDQSPFRARLSEALFSGIGTRAQPRGIFASRARVLVEKTATIGEVIFAVAGDDDCRGAAREH
jgi:hypothetical protein